MHAAFVALGILSSRVLGLVRESLKARYLGATGSIGADAFNAAFGIPNLLQNLFGEGALSASFIPVYANALARGNREEASRIAGAVGALLALVTAILVAVGIAFAPVIVPLLAPGFEGAKRDLTIQLTRVLFPGAAIFVMGAWCLGVLNSHRRFFLSYVAPVAWNVVMIAVLLFYRRSDPAPLAMRLAWASVAGAALTVLVQLPVVLKVAGGLRLSLGRGNAAVRTILRNFLPAFLGRGVVQISAFVDRIIASYISGGVSLLFYTQTIVMLPVSLFGMSVSAAELPEMSSATGSSAQVAEHVRTRLGTGLRQIAFFVIPCAVAFLLLGDAIIRALFESGKFGPTDTMFAWGILAAASVGLLATTLARLYSSSFYALHDTRTPLRISIVRVTTSAVLGAALALWVPRALGIAPQWGAAMLALASSVAGWLELSLLRRALGRRIGASGLDAGFVVRLLGASVVAGAVAFATKLGVQALHRFVAAAIIGVVFGVTYLLMTRALGVPEVQLALRRLRLSR